MRDLHSADVSLLEAARSGSDPTEADQARLRKRLVVQLGPAALGLSAAATSTSTALGAGTAGVLGSGWSATKLIVALALAAGAGGGGMAALEAATSPRAPVAQTKTQTMAEAPEHGPRAQATTSALLATPRTTTVTTAATTPNASTAEVAPLEATAPTAPRPPTPARVESPAPIDLATTPKGALDDEMKLLAAADAALRSDDGARALALIDEHAQRYPRSALDQERSVERVLALCAQGRLADARDAAARFVSTYPSSPYVARVRTSCAGGAAPGRAE